MYIDSQYGNIIMSATSLTQTNRVVQIFANGSITIDAPEIYLDGDIKTTGLIKRVPKTFTTSRQVSINGTTCHVYDID